MSNDDAIEEYEIDPAEYRSVLGHFPTGVTVVAGLDADGNPSGLAIGSFFSISLDPALVGFCVGSESGSWGAIRDSKNFVVNVLAETQADVCGQFAGKSADKFAGVDWSPSVNNGAPRITGCVAYIDCVIHETVRSGDHDIVIGHVQGLDLAEDGTLDPLVFFTGKYHGLSGVS